MGNGRIAIRWIKPIKWWDYVELKRVGKVNLASMPNDFLEYVLILENDLGFMWIIVAAEKRITNGQIAHYL